MNAGNLKNGKDVFEFNNDSLKALLNRRIKESPEYKIDEMEIGSGSRVNNVQLSIWKHPKGSQIVVHSMLVEKNLDSIQVDNKLRRIYKK